MKSIYSQKRKRRSSKVRAKIIGTATCPRLTVFRSDRFIYAQLIEDIKGTTLFFASEKELKVDKDKKLTKTQRALLVGEFIAEKARKMKVVKVIFDRNGYKYHGRVKALAEGARKGGLQF